MRIGVVFPQTEIGADRGAVRTYAQEVEQLGYTHVLAYDHVLGADPTHHPGWSGPYTHRETFHEPMVLFGYFAGICSLEVVTGVIVLPQRQTALVAKQAAEVDILTGGKLRLGVGIGWNAVEYEALGEDFSTRGRRIEEQVDVMRRLWTDPVVTIDAEHHQVSGAGIAPMPVQRPIPVWLGAQRAPRALRRAGRIADGWMPQFQPGEQLDEAIALVHEGARAAGRDPASLGMEGRITVTADGIDGLADSAEQWRRSGATHLSVNTMGAGLATVDDHLELLGRAAAAFNG
ncbi:MAG TPA: LLM class F420-dependent oxidoreductase [Actinopolymorphaceae bacterium]|jgi:probable F420-dependent oxidoreductase|nr:LLM class F420-dependent oxidoreductase [Actinopolymorphaceae bacterium]